MSKTIQSILLDKAWDGVELQFRTGGLGSMEVELDQCTYEFVGKVYNGDFIRLSARYIKGMGCKLSQEEMLTRKKKGRRNNNNPCY